MSNDYFYYFNCLNCGGRGTLRCDVCEGKGKLPKYLGMASVMCPNCKGEKKLRCNPCAGRKRYKIFKLPDVLQGIPVEHSPAYYEKVASHLKKAINMIIDTVNYHLLSREDENSDCYAIDGCSTIRFNPGGLIVNSFVKNKQDIANASSMISRVRGDKAHYTRYIGKLQNISVLPTGLGCHYEVQYYYIDQVVPEEQRDAHSNV